MYICLCRVLVLCTRVCTPDGLLPDAKKFQGFTTSVNLSHVTVKLVLSFYVSSSWRKSMICICKLIHYLNDQQDLTYLFFRLLFNLHIFKTNNIGKKNTSSICLGNIAMIPLRLNFFITVNRGPQPPLGPPEAIIINSIFSWRCLILAKMSSSGHRTTCQRFWRKTGNDPAVFLKTFTKNWPKRKSSFLADPIKTLCWELVK